jgi:hypothetical protein
VGVAPSAFAAGDITISGVATIGQGVPDTLQVCFYPTNVGSANKFCATADQSAGAYSIVLSTDSVSQYGVDLEGTVGNFSFRSSALLMTQLQNGTLDLNLTNQYVTYRLLDVFGTLVAGATAFPHQFNNPDAFSSNVEFTNSGVSVALNPTTAWSLTDNQVVSDAQGTYFPGLAKCLLEWRHIGTADQQLHWHRLPTGTANQSDFTGAV